MASELVEVDVHDTEAAAMLYIVLEAVWHGGIAGMMAAERWAQKELAARG